MNRLKRYMRGFADVPVLAGTALAIGAAATAVGNWNDLSIPLFGVRVTVIMMAAGGAFASFAYGDPVKPRSKLYTLAAVNTFLAAIVVAVFPPMLGWQWSSPKIEPPLAALVAIGARWIVPAAITMVPELLRKILRLPPKGE